MKYKLVIRLVQGPPDACFGTYLKFENDPKPYLVDGCFFHTTLQVRRWLERAKAHAMPIELEEQAQLLYEDLLSGDASYPKFAAWVRRTYPLPTPESQSTSHSAAS